MERIIEAVLNFQQRRQRALNLKRNKNRILKARERAKKRLANRETIQKRSRRAAIKIVRKIVAGKLGVNYNEQTVSQKMMIDKKVAKKATLINRLALKLIPKMMAAEKQRFNSYKHNKAINEDPGAGFEATDSLVKKYKKDTPGQ